MGRQSASSQIKRKLRSRAHRERKRQLLAGMSFLYVGVGLHALDSLGRARQHTEVVEKMYLGFCLSTTLITPSTHWTTELFA
jgi:hypothetical protein